MILRIDWLQRCCDSNHKEEFRDYDLRDIYDAEKMRLRKEEQRKKMADEGERYVNRCELLPPYSSWGHVERGSKRDRENSDTDTWNLVRGSLISCCL
jgi:hypothetical protein